MYRPRQSKRVPRSRSAPAALPTLSMTRSVMYNTVANRPFAPHPPNPVIQVIMQGSTGPVITTSAVAPVGYSASFTLSTFAQASEYLSLFDQYRIDRMEVWLEPITTPSTSAFGIIASCIDFDDITVPTSLSQIEARQNSVVGSGAAAQYHCWKPRVALAAYSGTFTSFANVNAPWCDSGSSGVQHYGFKAVAGTTPSAIQYQLTFRGLVSFRQPGL